jgi:ferrous iron transport protein B
VDVTLSTVALVGPPNSGKSSLFNRLTGARQRVANYAGVTVDCREGVCALDDTNLRLLDLPGLYSLRTGSAEERLSQRIVSGHTDIDVDAVACVVDAANPELGLLLALDLLERPRPLVLILTAADLVDAEALEVARTQLERELAVPVITNSSTVRGGSDRVRAELKQTAQVRRAQATRVHRSPEERLRLAQALARDLFGEPERTPVMRWLDQVTLHAVLGPALLAVVLFFVFQAVFAWSVLPSESIEAGVAYVADAVELSMAPGALRDLLTQAVLGGVGGVLVFLPPILILFAFLVVLEESGYLPRAAFVLDPMMASIGLSGRSFIPLLSSFACAVPGIMATRTIPDSRTRATTMLLAPLMTCSARLPVYALLIGAFVPSRMVAWGISLQGLVMFCLYAASIACALLLAGIVHACRRGSPTTLMMELPSWRRPTLRAVALALRERAVIFLRRVGGILLALSVLMWGLTRFPAAPADGDHPAIYYSAAGIVGRTLQPLLAPLGFDWQVSIALVPGLAAREVAVAALGTMYAAQDEGALQETLASRWSMATAMSLLAWFIFAPQCFSTIAVLRRETGRWSASLGMTAGYFALAWLAAFFTYTLTSAVTGSS